MHILESEWLHFWNFLSIFALVRALLIQVYAKASRSFYAFILYAFHKEAVCVNRGVKAVLACEWFLVHTLWHFTNFCISTCINRLPNNVCSNSHLNFKKTKTKIVPFSILAHTKSSISLIISVLLSWSSFFSTSYL